MATATSTVSAAITGLMAAINAHATITADKSILVSEGPPTLEQPDDMIIVAERVIQHYTPHNLVGNGGQFWLYEDYTISVHVDVFRGGDQASVCRARCATLAAAVDDAVRNDPTLGASVNVMAYPAQHMYEQLWDADGKGRRCVCDIEIAVKATP